MSRLDDDLNPTEEEAATLGPITAEDAAGARSGGCKRPHDVARAEGMDGVVRRAGAGWGKVLTG